ncbi:hypothetical protein ACIPSA_03165 [Streptomyces sp. NPDC086549]|uniref:hypothetical protein n=1 Tax=Streptomyces sp. NPDC086549 TaxID=3365752 RepID=UPI00381DF2D0
MAQAWLLTCRTGTGAHLRRRPWDAVCGGRVEEPATEGDPTPKDAMPEDAASEDTALQDTAPEAPSPRSAAGEQDGGTGDGGLRISYDPHHGHPGPGAPDASAPPPRLWRCWALPPAAFAAGVVLGGAFVHVAGASTADGASTTPSGGPSTTNPEPGCRADACLSRAPQAMDCQWDAVTARRTWLRGLRTELRHSPSCQAVRGRIQNGTKGDGVGITDQP